jgi:hypothetical protein
MRRVQWFGRGKDDTMKVFAGWRSWAEASRVLARHLPTGTTPHLRRAVRFADHWGGRPTRFEAAEILVRELGVTELGLLTAGLLRHLVDDAPCTLEPIRDRFGARVAGLVDSPTVQLAGRYALVQRLHAYPTVESQRDFYVETCEYFVPMASAAEARFRDLYTAWEHAYSYLRRPVADLEVADLLAAAAHRGQVDKSGRPYVDHVRAVSKLTREAGGTPWQQLAGLLHDTVEDTVVSLAQLADLGVPPDVVAMVDALTRRPTESHEDYLDRLVETPSAVLVKRADIRNNLSPVRLARLDQQTQDRLRRKYAYALALLDRAAGPERPGAPEGAGEPSQPERFGGAGGAGEHDQADERAQGSGAEGSAASPAPLPRIPAPSPEPPPGSSLSAGEPPPTVEHH